MREEKNRHYCSELKRKISYMFKYYLKKTSAAVVAAALVLSMGTARVIHADTEESTQDTEITEEVSEGDDATEAADGATDGDTPLLIATQDDTEGLLIATSGDAGEGTAVDAGVYVKKIALSDDFYTGVDVSSYLSEIESGVKYYDFEGNLLDEVGFFKLL